MGITYKEPVPTPEQIRVEYKVPEHVKELKKKKRSGNQRRNRWKR